MLSLSQFRYNVFALFKVLSSSGMVLEVVHNDVVYDVNIVKTDKKPKLTRPARRAIAQIRHIDTSVCEQCGSIMFNDICMNRDCIHSNGSLMQAKEVLVQQPAPTK